MNSNFGLLRTAPHRTASIRLIQVFFKDSGIAQSSRLLEVCYRWWSKVCLRFSRLEKGVWCHQAWYTLAKLESYGIKGNALQWVNSYLLGRSQFVVCSDSGSKLRHLPFGVPQGSVLGPTLFNIHINNVSKACHNSDVALFADNTEIHFSFKDVGEAEYIINEDLKSINQWFSNNGLICNTKKTMTMVMHHTGQSKLPEITYISR